MTGACNSAVVATTAAGQAVQLSGSVYGVYPSLSEAALMEAVSQAPIVVYWDAEASFQLYSGGIYSGFDCGANINHASE